MKFIITRHTATEWDDQERIKGHKDIPLSEKGESEAEILAETLGNLGIEYIVASDLKRAEQTAKIINKKLNVLLITGKDLEECSFGKLEGMTVSEIEKKYGNAFLAEFSGDKFPYDFREYGGECSEEVLARHMRQLKLLSEDGVFQTVLLVGHSLGMSTLLHGLGLSSNLNRGEYSVIEYPKGN